jgi:hypothetical protein
MWHATSCWYQLFAIVSSLLDLRERVMLIFFGRGDRGGRASGSRP